MRSVSLARRLAAELLGSLLLLAIVVGSGIMAEGLAGGNDAIALLANTVATGTGLIVLIHIFGPLSGAHFNPAVTFVVLIGREIGRRDALLYVAVQIIGAILGVWLAHAMFAEPVLQVATKVRPGLPQGLSEFVATFGLIGTITATQRARPEFTPVAVGLYISAAYWFTASTSFANPAVTIARSLSDSFAGIAPASVPVFLFGQLGGALAGLALFSWLYTETASA